MKKNLYIVPAIKSLVYTTESILDASNFGPGGGDAVLPGMTEDGDDGPGAGEYGGTPGYGANSMLHIKNVWED
jgi:hypothetical protein